MKEYTKSKVKNSVEMGDGYLVDGHYNWNINHTKYYNWTIT